MKEIGGYFQLDQLINKPYYNELVELNSGRNALIYLVKAKKIKKIFLPYYLCNSVSDILDKYNVETEYYHINKDFSPSIDQEMKKNEYLYVVNYYGQITNEAVLKLKKIYKKIILDNTQAFFQKPISNVDTIYSCRKFFGLSDGAYLSTNKTWDIELDEDQSSQRMKHILGRFEGEASDYYSYFKDNDKNFKKMPVKKMSKLTRNILGAIDYDLIKKKRNCNYQYLNNHLKPTNALKIIIPDGPFAYPYYVQNGIDIRKRLSKKKIYIPTLWPNVLEDNSLNSIEYEYTSNILPIPCDQRYDIEDMKIILKELK